MFIGIDVSKNTVDMVSACGTVKLQGVNPLRAAEPLRGRSVQLVVLEATGGYERPVVTALRSAGIPVAIVNPRQARDFAKALGKLAKTDRLDAAVLALFAERIKPPASTSMSAERQELQALMARRRQLLKMLTQEKNRLHQAVQKVISASLKAIIERLQQALKEVDGAITKLIRQTPLWNQQVNILRSVKGVGPVTAATLLADLPELGHAGRKQIAALAGLAPFTQQSGQWRGKSICSGGRRHVRTALYMAALAAARSNSAIRPFHGNLVARGKPQKVALTACMRKLLIVLNARIRDSMLQTA